MKVAVIGSRDWDVNNLEKYLPENTTEIVSGGAKGIDTCARNYANNNQIKLTEFLPDYKRFGRAAPIKRNYEIVDYSDMVIAFWNGSSKGTKSVIDYCKKTEKTIKIYIKGDENY